MSTIEKIPGTDGLDRSITRIPFDAAEVGWTGDDVRLHRLATPLENGIESAEYLVASAVEVGAFSGESSTIIVVADETGKPLSDGLVHYEPGTADIDSVLAALGFVDVTAEAA